MDNKKAITCTISGDPIDQFPFGLDEHAQLCTVIKKDLRDSILKSIGQGMKEFYTNCEIGVPLWAAEILVSLKEKHQIKINIAVPYENQHVKWSPEYRDRYFRVHESADKVTLIDYHYTDKSYIQADTYMIDNSKYLIYYGKDTSSFICQPARKNGSIIIHRKF